MSSKNFLALGMVFSLEERPIQGQEFRDRVRLEALENEGYVVCSLDNKHHSKKAQNGRHCYASFSDDRRLKMQIERTWGDILFDCIAVDYFFMPPSYVWDSWKASFFTKTLPFFANAGILKDGGQIWIPFPCDVDNFKQMSIRTIASCYKIEMVSEPERNPLFLATNKCESELLRTIKKTNAVMTNATQIVQLQNYSSTPFLLLEKLSVSEPCIPIREDESPILIRVCCGGDRNPQREFFDEALRKIQSQFADCPVEIEYLTMRDINRWDMGPHEVVGWLLDSDIHIILTHLHQDLTFWDCREVGLALHELESHIGFPSGSNLRCPIFQQDKYRYIEAVPDITIPTLRIDIQAPAFDHHSSIQVLQSHKKILEFMGKHTGYKGWVLKLPYHTCSTGVKLMNMTVDKVMDNLRVHIQKYGSTVPYVMLQPQLQNRQV